MKRMEFALELLDFAHETLNDMEKKPEKEVSLEEEPEMGEL